MTKVGNFRNVGNFMGSKKFLLWIGWFLVLLGVVGYFIGDLWLPVWGFSGSENLAHIVVGVVMLAAAYWARTRALFDWLVVAVGVLALFFAGYGWFVDANFRGLANLEQLDNIVHLVIGLWALWVVWGRKKRR